LLKKHLIIKIGRSILATCRAKPDLLCKTNIVQPQKQAYCTIQYLLA